MLSSNPCILAILFMSNNAAGPGEMIRTVGRERVLLAIAATFEAAGLPVAVSKSMDGWLKTHVAIISPLASAIYAASGDRLRLAHSRDALVLLVRSVLEGLRVLDALGVPITPSRLRLLGWLPEPLLVFALQRAVTNERFELGVVRHAMAARDEMDHLAAFNSPKNPPMLEGKSDLGLEWVGLWRLLAVAAVGMGVIGWLRRR